MGEGRQDQKAAPVQAGTDPGGAKAPGKAPPLPGRAANGAPSPRAPQAAAQDLRPITPGSGVSPVAPVAAPMTTGPHSPFMLSPSAPPPPAEDTGGITIPIDTEPPMIAQSGDTAPPPPELAPPGFGPPAIEIMPGHAPVPVADPTPVDFDALHAALGEGSREAAPPVATPQVAPATATATATAKAARPVAADSQGRSNATYASSRAQAPPAAHVDADLQAPAVIIAQEDTVPAAAPQMTTPMAPAMASPMAPPMSPYHPASGPHQVGAPSSGGMRAVPPHAQASHHPTGNTPQAFDPVALGLPPVRPGQVALTMRMPERPRRPRTPTVVVRPRGPSTRQKLFVFSIMLLLVSLIGLAIVMWRAPQLFGFGPKAQPIATTKPAVTLAPAVTTAAPSATLTATASAAPSVSAAPSAPASTSAAPPTKPGFKPKGR